MLKPLLLCASLLSSSAFAAWQLDNSNSDLSITSIKKNSIAENHHFKQLSGALSDEGKLTFSIELSSIETLIPIRNQRMQSLLFDVANFPQAQVSADLSSHLKTLTTGVQIIKSVPVELLMHGRRKELKLDLVVNMQDSQLHVTPLRAVLVNANDFDLAAGIEALRKIAGLDSIATMVPVTFSLVFNEQSK
ncbi:YceI family protein [Pseudoalteromonas sp. S16_S37]|uniref:YceI family protein n=1 Tax=Pseudoalteromonas sp. S16_S37 TaxID=2720228 RepID=UPI0016817962|nr:YceI family protein [Pseudoalteromonas sp. S16_S37]MBD1582405.1 YceI family protein [Pseudoalteromonas sp. S16_S37]